MPTDVTAATRRSHLDPTDPTPGVAGPPSRPPPLPACSARDGHLDASLAEACRNAARAPDAPANDRILYVGMNKDSASIERRALEVRRPDTVAIESQATSSVSFQGRSYDVSSPMGVAIFAQVVGQAYRLDEPRVEALRSALESTTPSGRDELARIALVWATADAGAQVPSRVILSGHSTGDALFGGHGGSFLRFEDVLALARAFPAAARQIEDVQISACFTEQHVQDPTLWRQAFPNLKTLWGYNGFSPAAPIGHLYSWEAATRGRTGTLKPAHVAPLAPATAWSASGGVVSGGATIDVRRVQAADAEGAFGAFFAGDRRIPSSHQPDADRAYAAFRSLAAHAGATPAERASASGRAEQMFRLRFYEQSVRGELQARHGTELAAAFREVGLDPVDFGSLGRKEALAVIEDFRRRTGREDSPSVARARAILEGVVDLSPRTIPASWCH